MSLVMKYVVLSEDFSAFSRFPNAPERFPMRNGSGGGPKASFTQSTYTEALGKNWSTYRKSGPLNMQNATGIDCTDSGRYVSCQACSFWSCRRLSFANCSSKNAACCCQAGLCVSGSRGEV